MYSRPRHAYTKQKVPHLLHTFLFKGQDECNLFVTLQGEAEASFVWGPDQAVHGPCASCEVASCLLKAARTVSYASPKFADRM
jgi:hypothetical protein